jgi:di/tricarboxylate transporter
MSPAVLALIAFLLAIALSMTTRINVGLLAIALAWLIGALAGIGTDGLIAGFPSGLFLTLAGVTLLFAAAKSNGTLDLLAAKATSRVRRENVGVLPVIFFVFAGVLSSVGPGAVASVAIVAPIAMPIGMRAGVPNLLSAVMVGAGANAGNLSPLSAIGAMVNDLMARVGLPGHAGLVFATNFLVHVLVGAAAYFLFGGVRLWRVTSTSEVMADSREPQAERRHWYTIGATLVWMFAVIVLRAHPGLAAIAAATLLILLRTADERDVIARIPWDIIFMVTGVTMLVAVLDRTGGMSLFTGMIAKIATPATLNGVIALVTGIISTYSSTSGVVLPAFLPMVPGLVRDTGGGDPLAVALSINVGSALVDVSPLSTLGALCVANVHDPVAARDLFRKLLAWGLSMALVGALLCGLLAGPFSRL